MERFIVRLLLQRGSKRAERPSLLYKSIYFEIISEILGATTERASALVVAANRYLRCMTKASAQSWVLEASSQKRVIFRVRPTGDVCEPTPCSEGGEYKTPVTRLVWWLFHAKQMCPRWICIDVCLIRQNLSFITSTCPLIMVLRSSIVRYLCHPSVPRA